MQPYSNYKEKPASSNRRDKRELHLRVSSAGSDEWGAQYFTAVSSQRALRHVGISEADYAIQFIYLKPPIPLKTH